MVCYLKIPLELEFDIFSAAFSLMLNVKIASAGMVILSPSIWSLNGLFCSMRSANRLSLATIGLMEQPFSMSRSGFLAIVGPFHVG